MRTRFYIPLLLALLLSFTAGTAVSAKGHAKKEVCIQLYSVRSILDGVNKDGNADRKYTDILNKLAKMGYTSVEAANYDQGRGTFYGRTPAQFRQDVEKAQKAISFDEEIDHQERDIESLCMKLLLQQQPVAKDLRLISAALKMITDMERIGDHASDISEMTILMADAAYETGDSINLDLIKEMAKETTDMVIKSVDAFVQKDMDMAHWVIKEDDVVDDLFNQFKQQLIKKINENVKNGEQATDMLMVAKYFERIGDHATNIAEWVIYSITGQHEN